MSSRRKSRGAVLSWRRLSERLPSSIGITTTRLLPRLGGHTILRFRSLHWCGYGRALLSRLLNPGRDARDELQALHQIGEAPFGERSNRLQDAKAQDADLSDVPPAQFLAACERENSV